MCGKDKTLDHFRVKTIHVYKFINNIDVWHKIVKTKNIIVTKSVHT